MVPLPTRARGRWVARQSFVVSALLLAVMALATAHPARADGDPASDYLWSRSLFVPTGTSSSARAHLQGVVDEAHAGGLPIKVAVIGSVYDLGSITPLWRRPRQYARFLGTELSSRFRGLLLVAMPNGFGLYAGAASVTSEEAALRTLRPAGGADDLLAAASRAVQAVAAADGARVAEVPKASSGSGRSSRIGAPAIVAAGALALTGLAGAIVLRRRQPRQWRPAIAASALTVSVMAAVGALALSHAHGRSSAWAASADSSGGTGEGFTWPPGQRPAPPFVLRDQSGRRVTPRAGGDRLTILAFVDPACRTFCPLEAAVLGSVERALPGAKRPAIVAVSVDPWGDARTNLITDIRKWQTGPSWRWAVGPRAILARVWKDYQVDVQVKVARVAGTTVHEVSHDEMIYVVDGDGFERVVWPWPFTQAELIGSIHRLQA